MNYNRIKLRSDTAAEWTSYNPVLLAGECGLETDTLKIKFGDGVRQWRNLPYLDADTSGLARKDDVDYLFANSGWRAFDVIQVDSLSITCNNSEGYNTFDVVGTAVLVDGFSGFTVKEINIRPEIVPAATRADVESVFNVFMVNDVEIRVA